MYTYRESMRKLYWGIQWLRIYILLMLEILPYCHGMSWHILSCHILSWHITGSQLGWSVNKQLVCPRLSFHYGKAKLLSGLSCVSSAARPSESLRFPNSVQRVTQWYSESGKYIIIYDHIWGVPEIGVPPNHPNFNGIFLYKPSSYGDTPISGSLHT